jgi:hypothetical protein
MYVPIGNFYTEWIIYTQAKLSINKPNTRSHSSTAKLEPSLVAVALANILYVYVRFSYLYKTMLRSVHDGVYKNVLLTLSTP